MLDTIILVGGMGTRLREVISAVPKPLAPINGVPFLDYLLASLPASHVILAAGYKAAQLLERYKDFENISLSIEETPLGTGGALRKALELATTPTVRVLNGDSFFEIDHKGFEEAHQKTGATLSMAIRKIDDACRYGSIEFHPQSLRITSFKEKCPVSAGGWINGGIYLMERTLLSSFPSNHAFSLENDVFPTLLNKPLFCYPSSGTFIDIGTKESYLHAQELLKPYEPHLSHWRSRLHRIDPRAKAS